MPLMSNSIILTELPGSDCKLKNLRIQTRSQQTFPEKGQTVNIFDLCHNDLTLTLHHESSHRLSVNYLGIALFQKTFI